MVSQGAANRRRGAQYETDLLGHFRGKGFDTERLRLSGKLDEGDLVVRAGGNVKVILEAKSGKNLSVRKWHDEEAVPEAMNYARRRSLLEEEVIPALVMKTPNKGIHKSLVVIDLETLVHLLQRAYGNEQ